MSAKAARYVRGGGFRHGWRWKLWWQVGDWLYGDVGLGRFWFVLSRLSITFDRGGRHDGRHVMLSFAWRRAGDET